MADKFERAQDAYYAWAIRSRSVYLLVPIVVLLVLSPWIWFGLYDASRSAHQAITAAMQVEGVIAALTAAAGFFAIANWITDSLNRLRLKYPGYTIHIEADSVNDDGRVQWRASYDDADGKRHRVEWSDGPGPRRHVHLEKGTIVKRAVAQANGNGLSAAAARAHPDARSAFVYTSGGKRTKAQMAKRIAQLEDVTDVGGET